MLAIKGEGNKMTDFGGTQRSKWTKPVGGAQKASAWVRLAKATLLMLCCRVTRHAILPGFKSPPCH